jgi:type I restriction enzyme S subunit
MHNGLIDQSEKFKKRIASDDTKNYKIVERNELVVGFPIDEGVLGFQTKYDTAAVSPAYDIWKLKQGIILNLSYLEIIFRSNFARKIYKSKMQGAVSRRRTVPKDIFVKIEIPLPPLEIQNAIVAEIEQWQKVIDGAKQVIANYRPTITINPD